MKGWEATFTYLQAWEYLLSPQLRLSAQLFQLCCFKTKQLFPLVYFLSLFLTLATSIGSDNPAKTTGQDELTSGRWERATYSQASTSCCLVVHLSFGWTLKRSTTNDWLCSSWASSWLCLFRLGLSFFCHSDWTASLEKLCNQAELLQEEQQLALTC